MKCIVLAAFVACTIALPAADRSWVDDLSHITAADWNYDRTAHLLERAGFGGTPEEIERLAAMPPQEAVRHLVYYQKVQNVPIPDFDASDFRSVYATMIKEWMGYSDAKTILKGDFATLGAIA